MAQAPSIDRLLNLVPDSPDQVLQALREHPNLASRQDGHGYSLLHAATSYGHVDLLEALVREFKVDPNIKDEDLETCLFNAESVDMAKALLELGLELDAKNAEGQSAAEKLDDEDEQPLVAAFLRASAQDDVEGASSVVSQTGGQADTASALNGTLSNGTHQPPSLPSGLQVNLGTMQAGEEGDEPDPEFKRRIEELAARSDFHDEEGQRELRNLVMDAVSGFSQEGQGPATRRRMG